MTTAIDITVPGRVWLDALDPDCSGMQAELGLGKPERRKVGKGTQYRYRAVPLDAAEELADYLFGRGDTLLGQGIIDPYDPMERAERDTLRAAVKTAERIKADVLLTRSLNRDRGGPEAL